MLRSAIRFGLGLDFEPKFNLLWIRQKFLLVITGALGYALMGMWNVNLFSG